MPQRQLWWVLLLGSAFIMVAIGTPAGAQDYQTELSDLLGEASVFLDEASLAIEECTQSLIVCLSEPDDVVMRIDAANRGLQMVVANISALEVPGQFLAEHALLLGGFGNVTDGFALYSEGLRDKDPGTLGVAADLITDGNNQIRAAVNVIFAPAPSGLDIVQILTFVVIGATIGMVGLLYVLLRAARQQGRARIEQELATCPECGEVLDQWWTYRKRQIREWLETHLRTHEIEGAE